MQQRWNAELYDARHAFVFEYGRELLALLEPKHGERGLAAWIAMFFASAMDELDETKRRVVALRAD